MSTKYSYLFIDNFKFAYYTIKDEEMRFMEGIKITDVRVHSGDGAFLIDDGETTVLYDTGFGFTGYGVAENIKRELGDRTLDYIFLTHSHYDHALGSAYILRKFPDAKVVAGEYAASVFEREGAKRTMRELDNKFARECGYGDYEFLGDELRVDIKVREGHIIKAGAMTFEVIELPGHTRCSVGYYMPDRKLLLSSETLGVFDGESVIIPSYLVSYDDTIASIEKVEALDVRRIICPHLGLISEEKTQFFLKNMKAQAVEFAQTVRAMQQNGDSDEEIISWFLEKYRHGYIEKIYPIAAARLNMSILIKLLSAREDKE